jgi:hypothetical protein
MSIASDIAAEGRHGMAFLRRMLGVAPAWPSSGPITAWPGDDIDPCGMNVLLMEPSGRAGVDVVGESHYQGTLDAIAGGKTTDGVRQPEHLAALIPQPTNPHDPNAVRVVIVPTKSGQSWGHVGHLTREDAVAYRPMIDAVAAASQVVGCRASLTGGWDRGHGDQGSIGVILILGTPEECARDAAARGVVMPDIDLSEKPLPARADPAAPREYANTACPYCGAELARLPKGKSKCKSCGNAIHVRLGPDGLTYLLHEADMPAMEQAWVDHYQHRD